MPTAPIENPAIIYDYDRPEAFPRDYRPLGEDSRRTTDAVSRTEVGSAPGRDTQAKSDEDARRLPVKAVTPSRNSRCLQQHSRRDRK